MSATVALENPLMAGIGPSAFRQLDTSRVDDALRDLVVISADSHFELSDDIFYKNFPSHLKAKAPRVWDPRAKGAEIRSVDLHNVDSLPQLIFYSADHYGTARNAR
jgi:hypothetical protein